MRRSSTFSVCVAVALAFVLAWAPALAQETGPLPNVDWPSESRFVSSMIPQERPPQLLVMEWPCESRFAARYGVALVNHDDEVAFAWPCEARFVDLATGNVVPTRLAVVDWPCEARFVSQMPHEMAMTGVDWPCEARYVALVPAEVATMAADTWPSEARIDPLLASAPRLSPPSEATTLAQLDANKLLHRHALEQYFATGATDELYRVYPEELALARIAEWRSWQNAFSDLEVTLDFQIAEGDRVVSCWTVSGVHSGEFMGVEPTDTAADFQVLYAAQVDDNHFVSEIGQVDLHTILENLDAEEGQHTS